MNIGLIARISLSIAMLSSLAHINCFAKARMALDAHVHGVSELTIAIEKQQLEIELRSPAMNMLSFEHNAITTAEKAAVAKAELLLTHHDKIFSFSGNSCVLMNQFIDVSSVIQIDKTTNNQRLDSHTHGDEHQHKQHMSEDVMHHEIIAKYNYRCKTLSTLPVITVSIFEFFPGIQQIETMWLTDTEQGFSVLNAHNQAIHLK